MQNSCCTDKKDCSCCGVSLGCTAKWLYAVPLFVFGLFHFLQGKNMVGMISNWPMPLFWVYLSGAGLILGTLAIVLNRYARLASMLLAVELGLFVLILHVPAILAGGEGAQMSVMSALKDIALIGGALFISTHSSNRNFTTK